MKKKLTILACIIAILVSLISISRSTCKGGAKYDPALDRCLGEIMARETAKLISGQGDVVVLSLAGSQFENQAARAQMKGFEGGLRKASGIRLAAVEGPQTKEAFGVMINMQGVPEDFFLRVLHQYPNTKAIVSFLGLPIFHEAGAKIDVTNFPKVIALGLELTAERLSKWSTLVENDAVSEVLWPRYDVNWEQRLKGDCNAVVASRYVIVDKTNLKDVQNKASQIVGGIPPTREQTK
jgi:hypothetical protein